MSQSGRPKHSPTDSQLASADAQVELDAEPESQSEGSQLTQNILVHPSIDTKLASADIQVDATGGIEIQPEHPPAHAESTSAHAQVNLAAVSEAGDLASRINLEAQERSSAILFSWHTLGDILDRHESELRSRWIKRSTTWRKTILSKTWTNMPLSHRPDICHLRKEALTLLENGTLKQRPLSAFMWPYINMEDLSREKPILCLLNTRARHSPSSFVDYELEICRLGIDSKTVIPLDLDGYTMKLEGETMESYGKLVAWGQNSMMKAGFTPGDGLLILEIQQNVLEFLVKWCEVILGKAANVLVTQFSIGAELASVELVSSWPTIEVLATHAPYLAPQKPDFNQLADLLAARHSAAQDHIWALREDPGYFENIALQWGKHRPESIHDALGNIDYRVDEPIFWDVTLSAMVDNVYRWLVQWDVLAKQAQVLLNLQRKYAGRLDPRYPLPPEYKQQIQLFRGLLLYFHNDQHFILKFLLPAAPLLRSSWLRETVNGNQILRLRENPPDRNVDPLLWIFLIIRDEVEYSRYGHKDVIDEMERLVFTRPEQKKRITPLIAELFSGLALLLLIQHEVENYHPWAAEFKLDQTYGVWISEEIPKIVSKSFLDLSEHSVPLVLAKVGTPRGPRRIEFSYPCNQRHSTTNAQTMWKSERNLDLFWQEADRQYEKSSGKTISKAFADRFTVKIELERTPESMFIEHLKELLTEQGDRKDAATKAEAIDKAMCDLQLQDKNTLAQNAPSQAVLLKDLQQVFKLDQRAFRVSKAIFYRPSNQDGPKEIAWADFLHFMSEMQFSPLKLYGNLWHFSHRFSRHIQFYEPQPDSTFLLRVAMQMGKRLRRTYEWHADMFVLAEGEGDGKGKRKRRGKGKSSSLS